MGWVQVRGFLLQLLEALGETLGDTGGSLGIGTTVMRL